MWAELRGMADRGLLSGLVGRNRIHYLYSQGATLAVPETPQGLKAYRTLAELKPHLRSRDAVVLAGVLEEEWETPSGVYDVLFVGAGNLPRQATEGGIATGGGAYWKTPASGHVALAPLCKVLHQSWKFQNICFQSPTDAPAIQFFRNAADTEDGSHGVVEECFFSGQKYAIESHGGVARLKILGNEFQLYDSSGEVAIKETVGAGTGTCWGWEIKKNTFRANHTDISGAIIGAQIVGNHFHLVSLGVTNTVAIDTTGGSRNLIAKNWMYSASNASGINARFVVGSADVYGPNYYTDIEEYGEPAE